MSNHTPGPWTYRRSGTSIKGEPGHEEEVYYPAHVVFIDKTMDGLRRTRFIARCSGADLPNDDNALLIAAAPELLEACKEVLDALNESPEQDENWLGLTSTLALAIAKAEPQGGAE